MPSYVGNKILLTAYNLTLYSAVKTNFIQKKQTIPIS